MALNQNQFSQIPVQGQLALRSGQIVDSAQVVSSQVVALVPGQPVKIVDDASKLPQVASLAADSDVVWGFVVYSLKDASFPAGARVEVARGFVASVMWMTASAAIARGADVQVDLTGVKVKTAASGKPISGQAMDKAAADGDLIRVEIVAPSKFNAP